MAYPTDEQCVGKGWGKDMSGGVKGVFAPDPDPGVAEPDDDPDGDDF